MISVLMFLSDTVLTLLAILFAPAFRNLFHIMDALCYNILNIYVIYQSGKERKVGIYFVKRTVLF